MKCIRNKPNLHVLVHVDQRLGLHKRFQEIIRNVLVANANQFDFVEEALFHGFLNALVTPIVSHLVVHVLLSEQIA
jgi:hypothetical protein